MACVVITPSLAAIAKELGISPVRAAFLAGLSSKNDNWTKEDISAELAKQRNDEGAKFLPMIKGVTYEPYSYQKPLVYSDQQGVIHIAAPTENIGDTIVNFLQGISNTDDSSTLLQSATETISQDVWDNIQDTVNTPEAAKLFLNYYAMHRIAYNYSFATRTEEQKKYTIKRVIEDSMALFNEWLKYSDQSSLKRKNSSQEQQIQEDTTVHKPITGTRATANGPIVLTAEQQTAVNNAVDFIQKQLSRGDTSGKNYVVIQGKAGTGKTTIVREIIKGVRKSKNAKVAVAALSRKAANVLYKKTKDLRVNKETLYTLAGADYGQSEDRFAIDPQKNKFSRYDIIFVDEASMVSPSILEAIDKRTNGIVVFLGDPGQLRPINAKGIANKSQIFSRGDMQIEALTERIRQGEDSPILSYIDDFWTVSTGAANTNVRAINKDAKTTITDAGALIFKASNGNIIDSAIEAFRRSIETSNPNLIKIVAAHNKTINAYNEQIHRELFPESPNDMSVGDIITFNAPYSRGGMTIADNSEEGIITDISPTRSMRLSTGDSIHYAIYVIKLSDGTIVDIPRLNDATSIAIYKNYLANLKTIAVNAPKESRRYAWRNYYTAVEKFADISYGYAITTHKAQGSTYDMVIVDKSDIQSNPIWSNAELAENIYTAATRSRNITVILDDTADDTFDSSLVKLNDSYNKEASSTVAPSKVSSPINEVAEIPSSERAQSFIQSLTQEQRTQFSRLFGPYDEGGGADINELFVQPLPKNIDRAITDVNMGDGEMLTRDMMVWIVQNLKEENRQYLSSFYSRANEGTSIAEQIPLTDYEFYSGAAQGSDTEWATQARALGIKVKDYTTNDWDNLPQEWKGNLEKEYQESVSFLGRTPLDINSQGGKLVRRDMMQADKADAIFAVSTVIAPGEYDGKYENKTNHDNVSGGTGYAVARGIIRGIPVYLFDQKDNTWKVWRDNKFVPTTEPTLTPHAATIGTRNINENGKQAIKSILSKVGSTQSIQSQQTSSLGGLKRPTQVGPEKIRNRVDILTIADNTESFGVQIEPHIMRNYHQWLQNNPNGIVAYRALSNYNTPSAVSKGVIGNPFNWQKYGTGIAGQMFYDWLTTGNNFNEPLANEEFRQAIINRILNTESPNILYYKELGYPSHATVLGYLISNKNLLSKTPVLGSKEVNKNNEVTVSSTARVADAKLLNKQQILDAIIEDGKLYVDTAIQGYDSNHVQGQITFDRGRWNYRTIKPNNVSWDQLTKEEKDFLESTSTVDRNLQEQAIDKYIPKDLQEYYLSGKNKEDDKAYIDASDKLEKEHPDWKIEDRIAALMDTSLGEANYVRDTWRIYSYDPYASKNAWNIRTSEQQEQQTIGGFTRQQSQEQAQSVQKAEVTKAPPMQMPQANTNYLVVKDRATNPLTYFNTVFSGTARKEAAEALAIEFSDIVDRCMMQARNNAKAQGDLDTYAMLSDTSVNARRKYIMRNMSGKSTNAQPGILASLRESLSNYIKPDSNERKLDLAKFGEQFVQQKVTWINKILGTDNPNSRNFEILLSIASPLIANTEGVIIEVDNMTTAKAAVREESSTDATSNNNDPEDVAKDGWMIKNREVDPRTTVSEAVKKVLSTITRRAKDVNFMGKKKLINADYAHAVLIDACSKIAYVEDFITKDEKGNLTFPVLEKLAGTKENPGKYPWVASIIRKLQNNPTLASQFFTDFRKDFISYISTITNTKNGDSQTITKNVNETVAKDAALSAVITNIDLGNSISSTPIYKEGKIDADAKKIVMATLNKAVSIFRKSDYNSNNKEDRKEVLSNLAEVLQAVGFNSTEADLEALHTEAEFDRYISSIMESLGIILSLDVPEGQQIYDFFNTAYSNIAEIIGVVSEESNVMSFRQADKSYYSYSAPNYINTLIKRLKDNKVERLGAFIEKEYKKYNWFYNKDTQSWRNYWMKLIESDEYVRQHLNIQDMVFSVSVNDYGKRELNMYMDWENKDMAQSFITQYFSIPTGKGTPLGKYHTPIFSDSTTVSFITMPRFSGEVRDADTDTTMPYTEFILEKLVDVAEQEVVVRMSDITERRKQLEAGTLSKDQRIANYDSHGDEFLFFPALNKLVNVEEIRTLYKQGSIDEARNIMRNAIRAIMEKGLQDYIAESGLTADFLVQSNIIEATDNAELLQQEFREAVSEYYWNQAFATTQIIQLTTTDLAYYKDGIDFQKRFKEVFASGNKLNTKSPYARTKERVMYLHDEVIKSVSYKAIKKVLSQAVDEKRITKLDMEAILSKFREVNVADAQAYRSISSMRAVLDMMGQWTPEMEEALNKFKDGTWTIKDFSTVWQTLKPFVFTQIEDRSGNSSRKVPHQNKNSEFLLLASWSLLAASNIGKSPILRELDAFMEDNNIDVVMFESAVKAGGQATVEIHDGMTAAEVRATLNKAITQPQVIKEFDYEDYVIQQPTPEHLIDHISIYGSQFRNLIVSDISDDAIFTVKDAKGNTKNLTKKELLDYYQQAIVENLLDDYEKVAGKFKNIQTLQASLLEVVRANPDKYGTDIINALQIVDGKFNIPLDCPTITDRVQEVVNSFFKNAITKQHIKGGNAILVSDFGFVNELKCLYKKDKNGKEHLAGVECYLPAYSKQFYLPFMKKDAQGNEYLDINEMPEDLRRAVGYRIPTEDKYSMVPLIIKGFLPQANGSAIMLPADITVHAGSDFDIDKLFLMLPEFRVYTHDLRKAKEDFQRINNDKSVNSLLDDIFASKEVDVEVEATPQDFKEWFEEHEDEYKYDKPRVSKVKYDYDSPVQNNTRAQRNNLLIDLSFSILTNPDTVDKFVNPGSFDSLKYIARVNELAYSKDRVALLTNWANKMIKSLPSKIAEATDQDDKAALTAKLNRAKEVLASLKANSSKDAVATLLLDSSKLTVDDLKDIIKKEERDPLNPLTFFYYHKQNMTGAKLIGIYANNTTIFSKFQSYDQKTPKMLMDFTFMLDGMIYSRLDGITSPSGERISKNCAQFSAAAVDNVKDPVLAKLLQNEDTAKLTALMLRLGLSVSQIGLIFRQPILKEWLEIAVAGSPLDYAETLESLITQNFNQDTIIYLKQLRDSKENFNKDVLNSKVTSKDLLLYSMTYADNPEILSTTATDESRDFQRAQLRILLLMDKLLNVANNLNSVTQTSRADSPNGAIDPSIAGNMVQKFKVENVKYKSANSEGWHLVGADVYEDEQKINSSMNKDQLREAFHSSRFPMLQAFYSLGIDFAGDLMKDYFTPYKESVQLAARCLNAISNQEVMSDEHLQEFYRSLVTYELSDLDVFVGKNFDTQRDFYLTQFPARYYKILAANPHLKNLGIFKHIVASNGMLWFENSGRLTESMKSGFMRDLDELLYMGDTEKQLALDLFVYSYYKDGLYFGPNSYGNFFSSHFLNQIPSFINRLRNINPTEGSLKKYIEQYLLNTLDTNVLPMLPKLNADDGVSTDSSGKTTVYLTKKDHGVNDRLIPYQSMLATPNGISQPYYRSVITNEAGETFYFLWRKISDTDSGATYERVEGSQKFKGIPRYNKKMTTDELASYELTQDMVNLYKEASDNTPIEVSRQDSTPKEYVKTTEPETVEQYGEESNANKTNFC